MGGTTNKKSSVEDLNRQAEFDLLQEPLFAKGFFFVLI